MQRSVTTKLKFNKTHCPHWPQLNKTFHNFKNKNSMYVFGTFGSEEAVTVTLNLYLTANVNKNSLSHYP